MHTIKVTSKFVVWAIQSRKKERRERKKEEKNRNRELDRKY